MLCDDYLCCDFKQDQVSYIKKVKSLALTLENGHFLSRHKFVGRTGHLRFLVTGDHFQFINRLLSCARFLIYRCKLSNSKPDMSPYFIAINLVKNSVLYTYIKAGHKDNLNSHFRKWAYFTQSLFFFFAPVVHLIMFRELLRINWFSLQS